MTLRDPNILDKLGRLIPGYRGYADRDLRRTADQRVRHAVARLLDDAKSSLNPVIDELLGAGKLDSINGVHGLQRRLSLCADTIRHAEHGGSGLFDATVVRAADLDRAAAHDLGLHQAATELVTSVRTLTAETLAEALPPVRAQANELLAAIKEREQIFQEVFQCPS